MIFDNLPSVSELDPCFSFANSFSAIKLPSTKKLHNFESYSTVKAVFYILQKSAPTKRMLP